ncbi:armadillo-type protein [Suillus occidentalis]|nr:armadillo-type protein [Suillus occidentalis]
MSWTRDLVQEDWQKAMQIAQGRLLTSSTRIRLHFLQEELLWLATNGGLSLRQIMDVFKLLTQTYPRYVDGASRDAVEEVGMTQLILGQKLGVTEQVLGWLANEVSDIAKRGSPSTYAPADIFVLLSWACGLYATCLRSSPGFTSSPPWKLLVDIFATLLDMQLNRSTHTKATMQKSALVRTRRALRSAPEELPALMATLVAQAKSSQTPLIQISLLSTAVDVTLRLKNVKDHSLTQIPSAIKNDILDLYTTCVVMSKNPVPSHSSSALHDFIGTCVTSSDLTATVLPTMEKALLRSPEYSLSGTYYSHNLDSATFKKLLTASLNSAKSNNPVVRTNATGLFKVLISKDIDSISVGAALTDAIVMQNVPQLLVKETNDAAVGVLTSIMTLHLTFILKANIEVPADATTVITKEMTNTKPVIRRAFVSITGSALWNVDTVDTDAVLAFSAGITSALETNLKIVIANPLAAAVGPLEGYVALALLMGPLTNTGKFGDIVARNTSIEVLTGTQAKPSFIISDKIYQKLTDVEDELWLLRAANLSLFRLKNELAKNEQLQIGSVFVHLSIHSHSSEVRRAAIQTIEAAVQLLPQLVIPILLKEETEKPAPDNRRRYAALLLCCGGNKEEAGAGERDDQLVDLIVLAHHSVVCPPSRMLWIELCQKAGVDPHNLVSRRVDQAMSSILTASTIDSKFGFADASYQAISTLVFQLRTDIDPSTINALSEAEFGIWETPEGTTYVDVLSSQKAEEGPKKGKDADIARWEAELRKSLANKKGALVQAQLDKEAVVRQRVTTIKLNLQRGLSYVQSLASINVPELRMYVSFILSLLLEGAMGQGSRLVGSQAFEAYLDLAKCCSARLDSFHKWVGVATLRSLGISSVPEELQAEQLSSLVLRVLYRLRSLSEQTPFDAATFSYAFPLLASDVGQDDGDEALEQVTLVLDIIKFHCSEFSDAAFPRKATMEYVLQVIRHQPRLSKEASSVLIDLGEAVQSNANRDEVGVLIDGTLLQEVYVRNACLQAIQPFDLTDLDWSPQLWVACHDDDEQNARLSNHTFLDKLLNYLEHDNAYVRTSTASAIAEAVIYWPRKSALTIAALQDFYREKAKILAPEFDEYGMVIASSLDRSDPWATRVAVALAFEHLAQSFTEDQIEPFFVFLIKDEALGDRSPDVRRGMLRAGTAVARVPRTTTGDQIKEAVVILFGRVARHLDASDTRIPSIVDRLVEALKTPAEQVQIAVSDCLVPLVKLMGPGVRKLVDHLFEELFDGPKYASRRGAAYGLAGTIKGLGVGAMKEYDIINRLRTAAEDKKRFETRQGAMFAFETLSNTLGSTIRALYHIYPPHFAAQDAARVIMGNMSGYGVKLILPSLLSGLDEKQWRSKRVKTAANKSLKQFGEVINNPEIQALVPTLLKALVDPAKTTNALSALLKTSFMHYIDHSSLALVIPIIERGLRERGTEGKKRAAQIVGNLASLTDSKDFVPYLSSLLPLVHLVLVDPVPEARATAAKALGTLVERLGEAHFPDVVPGLLRTLKTDTSGVDRQGAAQGLSEVLSGLGMERLEGLLPDIIANAQSPRSTVREGFMSLLVYLPATFGARFQPHLPKIISPILSGLSDTEEYVREAAMRAGRMIVTNYSTKAIDLLLPELEQGMFDAGWRIRQSSITLVGELLFKVSGISGKAEVDEEEEVAEVAVVESSRRALTDVLGEERRNRILSALYLARQDAVNVVRTCVYNTPRTVREILPELLYSSEEFEQQETATRTTAELSRKSGEKVLGEIFSILHTKSHSPDIRTREGVCLMLCDVMESTSDAQRDGHENEIINMVRTSLVDDDASVRSAAAKAFDALQEHLGARAIDQTIPTLLEALRQPGASSDTALQALREVMSVRASTVFPVLIPTLIATPMTVFNARALASLVTVAGHALSKRLIVILGALVKVLEEDQEDELRSAIDEAVRALLASIEDPEGLNTLMLLCLGWAKSDAPKRRISSCNLFAVFCEESDLDSSLYRIDWVRQLVSLFDDQEVPFDVFVKSVPKDELESLVSTGAPGRYVPGFSLQKGVAPAVPIIIAGLTNGSNEQRENAAYAIGDLVERTEESAIKPFVVPFTGPLIRVATQATTYPPGVKTAILSALASMLERIPGHVKPFFPQLQRTFVKAIGDTSSAVVRTRAADALGILMHSQPRVDPVVTELIAGARSSEEEIAASFVLALSNVVKSSSVHGGIGDKARESCIELVNDAFRETHEGNAYLISGTPPSALASHAIVAVLSPDSDDYLEPAATLFAKLGLLRSVALKVKESAANERPTISRPAREARDILKNMAVDEESLAGIF